MRQFSFWVLLASLLGVFPAAAQTFIPPPTDDDAPLSSGPSVPPPDNDESDVLPPRGYVAPDDPSRMLESPMAAPAPTAVVLVVGRGRHRVSSFLLRGSGLQAVTDAAMRDCWQHYPRRSCKRVFYTTYGCIHVCVGTQITTGRALVTWGPTRLATASKVGEVFNNCEKYSYSCTPSSDMGN